MVELTTVSVPPTWAMPPPPAPALLPEKVELMIVFEKCRVVKTYLRKDKARTQQVLEKVIADALETITAGDCLGQTHFNFEACPTEIDCPSLLVTVLL